MVTIQANQRVSIAEFEAFLGLPENADKMFELINGEIIEVPSNTTTSHMSSTISGEVYIFNKQHKLGYVTDGQGGYTVNGERFAPDVGFIRLEKGLSMEWFHPLPPDLAVEVDYPSTAASRRILTFKITNYLAAGTLVWVVYGEAREVEVYAPGQPPKLLTINDTLDGGDVLPGFTLPVREIFPPDLEG